jgi:bifunctional non-homologous end joining protein LigD
VNPHELSTAGAAHPDHGVLDTAIQLAATAALLTASRAASSSGMAGAYAGIGLRVNAPPAFPGRILRGVARQPVRAPRTPALMHATEVARPFHRDGWVYEEKVDGWRMVAIKAAGSVRLVSRNGRDHTRRFPELVKALGRLKAKTFTLDGEVAVFDKSLISRFEWLRGRPAGEPATLLVYMVFDLLERNGSNLREQPLRERRRLLERLVSSPGMVFPARRLARNGLKAWQEALERGYEGIVAKDSESRYIPGRTLYWLKMKQKDYRKEERGFHRE